MLIERHRENAKNLRQAGFSDVPDFLEETAQAMETMREVIKLAVAANEDPRIWLDQARMELNRVSP